MMNQVTHAETADFAYKSLYKLGGAAALIVVVLTLSEVIGLTFYPQPSTVSGWFMLFQSNRIIGLLDFAAATDAQRSTFLAAGQAMLANTNQRAVGGFNMGLFLVSVAGLMVSSVMLQSNSFSRLTAYVGILANGLSLADYLREALTSSATVALLVILPSALFLMIWFALVGRRLYQLGRLERKTLPKQS